MIHYRKLMRRRSKIGILYPTLRTFQTNQVVVSTLCKDLPAGFDHIGMQSTSTEKTAFNIANRQFNTSECYSLEKCSNLNHEQGWRDREQIGQVCHAYMNDIMIMSSKLHEPISNFIMLFQIFREKRLKIQPDQSKFIRKYVEILRHHITPQQVKLNPRGVVALKKCSLTKAARETKSFSKF